MGNSESERIKELDNSGAEKKPFKDWTLARVGVGRKEGSGAFATLAPTQYAGGGSIWVDGLIIHLDLLS